MSRAFSNYVDAVAGNVIKNWSMRSVPLRGSFLAEYPGFLALGLITLLAGKLNSRTCAPWRCDAAAILTE